MLEDLIQNIESDNCGPFQLFFYKNLFEAAADSEILSHKKLTKNTIKTLLYQVFH